MADKEDKKAKSILENLRSAIMSGAGDRRDKYLKELEEYSTGKSKKNPNESRKKKD